MSAALTWGDPDAPAAADRVAVRFGTVSKENPAKTAELGRPIFDEVEYVEIYVPGDKGNIVHRAVRDEDRHRFRAQYDAWKAGRQDAVKSGFPLSEWPGISRSQVDELAYFRVRTVEELAALSDGNAEKMGPCLALRQKARDYLAQAKEGAQLVMLRDENAALKLEVESLRRQLKERDDALERVGKGKKQ